MYPFYSCLGCLYGFMWSIVHGVHDVHGVHGVPGVHGIHGVGGVPGVHGVHGVYGVGVRMFSSGIKFYGVGV